MGIRMFEGKAFAEINKNKTYSNFLIILETRISAI